MRHACVEAELIMFARHESASARPDERLVGSSEVEESVFGKLKSLEGDQSSSGFTRYVLSLGAVVGDWTTTRIKEALEKTPVKPVEAWCKEHLPVSVQAQRRLAFPLTNRKQISPDQYPNATPTLLLPRVTLRKNRTLESTDPGNSSQWLTHEI